MVTVAIYGWESESERDACVGHVRAQTLQDVEILTQGEGEDSISFRNRAIAEAKGSHITFLHAKAEYAFPNALQLMALTAQAEDAEMVVGKCGVENGVNTLYPDGLPWDVESVVPSDTYQNQFKGDLDALNGCLWNVSFLRKNGLDFEDGGPFAEERLIRKSAALAGTVFELGRAIVWCNDACSSGFTKTETNRARIGFYLGLLRFAAEKNLPKFKDFVSAEIFESPHTAELRNYYWSLREGDEKSAVKAELESLAALTNRATVEETFLNPLVSVIVPAYNVEKYLPRCLDSLVGQTLASIEIIVVDDGSPDRSGAIADEYAAKYPQVKVVHRENSGLSAARNSGMAVALGKYIGFVDGDDWVEPLMYAELSVSLERDSDAQMAMCGATVEFGYDVPADLVREQNAYFEVPCEEGRDLAPELIWMLNVSACTKLYCSDFLKTNGLRFPEGLKNEDEVFFFMSMARAHRMQFRRGNWYHYIRNDGGIMNRQILEMEQKKSLPDGLTRSLPLILAFLKWDDRMDLIGIAWRRLCGFSNRFPGEETYRFVSRLLHDFEFKRTAAFLDKRDVGYVSNRLWALYNWDSSSVSVPPINISHFPKPRARRHKLSEGPLLTFVVPVYNVERYLSACLESLRRQTEERIEIICVDDGSSDDSKSILEEYAQRDGRIRVFHQENRGASAARNLGLSQALGRYIAFVDGDDWMDADMVSVTVRASESLRLDVCFFDLQAFDFRTGKPVPLYWTVANHRDYFSCNRVFAPSELPVWRFSASPCMAIYRREFLLRHDLRFPPIPLCEDAAFIYRMLAKADRAFTIDRAFYHYRRGNPSSAVSRLTAGRSSGEANEAQLAAVREMIAIYRNVYKATQPQSVQRTFRARVLTDLLFYAERSSAIRAWLCERGWQDLDAETITAEEVGESLYRRLCSLRNEWDFPKDGIPCGTPSKVAARMRDIVDRRRRYRQDLYIVTGQLNSTTNEPIDSWTFFQWLQSRGVPSRYVIWKRHEFYAKLKREGRLKDVIALKGDSVADFEFLEACETALCRAKVVIQENGALNARIRKWLYALDGCDYVFLQHGVFYTWMTDDAARFLSTFNTINVASERERKFIGSRLPSETFEKGDPFVIGGLPRWDSLRDLSEEIPKEKVVFVMFTWRKSFNAGIERIKDSAYYHGLKRLLSAENVERLAKKGVKIVFAAHHHLTSHVKDLDFDVPVQVVPSSDISYWIRHAVVCVTDFSSVSIDFLFQNKPTVYWLPDVDDELLDPNVSDDGGKVRSATVELRNLFNVVDSAESVIEMVEHYAAVDFVLEPEKRAIAETFFAHKKDVCQTLYESLEKKNANGNANHEG